jgi:PhnB protein
MKLDLHVSLAFNGQCETAFRFYEQCLNGRIAFMLTWGNSPMAAEAPPGWDAKIAHATLKIGDTVITGSDVPPDRYEQPRGFELVLQMDACHSRARVSGAG